MNIENRPNMSVEENTAQYSLRAEKKFDKKVGYA